MRPASEFAPRESVWILSLVSSLLFGGCTVTETENDNTTNTFVTIVSVTSESGDFIGLQTGTDLFSDVCGADEENPPCTVFNDNAVVTFVARLKDLSVFGSPVNDVVFERYRVTYTRADGRNVPGIDVPYPFDGVSSFRVASDGVEVTRTFIVVRLQAKHESPLREISLNSSGILSVLTRMDFFGRDGAGRQIQVSAFLNITFADFGN